MLFLLVEVTTQNIRKTVYVYPRENTQLVPRSRWHNNICRRVEPEPGPGVPMGPGPHWRDPRNELQIWSPCGQVPHFCFRNLLLARFVRTHPIHPCAKADFHNKPSWCNFVKKVEQLHLSTIHWSLLPINCNSVFSHVCCLPSVPLTNAQSPMVFCKVADMTTIRTAIVSGLGKETC